MITEAWNGVGGIHNWNVKVYVDESPNIAHFMRFVRPMKNGELDANRGVAFSIELDYVQRHIHFTYATCNGDNFDKLIATERCDHNIFTDKDVFCIPMHNDIIHKGQKVKGISPKGAVYDIIDWVGLDSFNKYAREQLAEVYPELV